MTAERRSGIRGTHRIRAAAVAGALALAVCAQGAGGAATNSVPLRFDPLFGDYMVLQRDKPVPVWGKAGTGDTVIVTFNREKCTATADSNGVWMARLPELKASETPGILAAQSQQTGVRIALSNVLVGEVWLASGESNMECPLRLTQSGEREIGLAVDPHFRLFEIARQTDTGPDRGVKGVWKVCSPTNAPDFAAVPYFFGRYLRKDLRIPVGIIRSTWGGTPVRAWAPAPAATEKPPAEPSRTPGSPRSAGPSAPGVLYRSMIEPLCPFAIRGAIWYQGESDSAQWSGYAAAFGDLIRRWRAAWGYDFPFLFTQIAPFSGASPWIREAQMQTWRSVPGTAMAVTVDVGDGPKEHPRRKAPVGWRLDRAALALAYGRTIEYSGPLFEALTVKGDRAIVSFSHVGEGLASDEGALRGFEIAGADRVFKPATAVVEGTTVVATSPLVKEPKAVRYGWAAMPACNLFNRDGFPASPFRTDSWEPESR